MKAKIARWAVFLASLASLAVGEAAAGPFFGPPRFCDPCWPGPGTYSPLHYWVPSAYRYRAFHSGPPAGMYAPGPYTPDHVPEVHPSSLISPFPCPYADPTSVYDRPGAYNNGSAGPAISHD